MPSPAAARGQQEVTTVSAHARPAPPRRPTPACLVPC